MEIKCIKVGELTTNCYLLISDNEILIIDPGAEAEKILKEIEKHKGKVKYIINTHHHFDHVMANKEVSKQTGAEILINLKEGDEVKINNNDLKIISTPGHTEDSICLLGQNFIFTGDTLFKDGYGRTDLFGGSDIKMEESLKRLSKIIKPGIMVYPGHGEFYQEK